MLRFVVLRTEPPPLERVYELASIGRDGARLAMDLLGARLGGGGGAEGADAGGGGGGAAGDVRP
jgi:hypothetical protein